MHVLCYKAKHVHVSEMLQPFRSFSMVLQHLGLIPQLSMLWEISKICMQPCCIWKQQLDLKMSMIPIAICPWKNIVSLKSLLDPHSAKKNISAVFSLFSKFCWKKTLASSLLRVVPRVFRGLQNFEPSHGICPFPRHFAKFYRS